jgi:hypothetical protein
VLAVMPTPTPNCIQMVRKEIAGLASVGDDVSLGYRAAKRPAVLADFKVLEIALLNLHGCFAVAPLMTSRSDKVFIEVRSSANPRMPYRRAPDASHQGWALSGVAGLALDSKAASTNAIVVQASSTDAIR